MLTAGFPGGSDDKESTCKRPGFHLWLGRSPGEGNGNPLHYSCLENPMDRGAWQATVPGHYAIHCTPGLMYRLHNSLLSIFSILCVSCFLVESTLMRKKS